MAHGSSCQGRGGRLRRVDDGTERARIALEAELLAGAERQVGLGQHAHQHRGRGAHGQRWVRDSADLVATRVARLLGPGPLPLRVGFAHRPPEDTSAHLRVFGPNVRFAQTRAELVFATAVLAGPLATHDPAFLEAFASEEEKLSMSASRVATSTKERVHHLVLARMRQGDASVGAVARLLGVSSRTLQRQLQQEQSPFSALVDDVRAAEARRCILERKLALGEIAFRLGFSQQSAFLRAFKRWTGTTPSELRKNPPPQYLDTD